MKKTLLMTLCITFSIMLFTNMNAQTKLVPTEEAVRNLQAYPVVLDSLERHVIYLDKKENEDLYKVELIAGKILKVDCNHHRLAGIFKKETVQGWGYNYFKFETEGHIMSTLMACPGDKTEKFVSGESLMIHYNSRLPIVVYLPKRMILKYKIWSAGEEQTASQN